MPVFPPTLTNTHSGKVRPPGGRWDGDGGSQADMHKKGLANARPFQFSIKR